MSIRTRLARLELDRKAPAPAGRVETWLFMPRKRPLPGYPDDDAPRGVAFDPSTGVCRVSYDPGDDPGQMAEEWRAAQRT